MLTVDRIANKPKLTRALLHYKQVHPSTLAAQLSARRQTLWHLGEGVGVGTRIEGDPLQRSSGS